MCAWHCSRVRCDVVRRSVLYCLSQGWDSYMEPGPSTVVGRLVSDIAQHSQSANITTQHVCTADDVTSFIAKQRSTPRSSGSD